MGKFIISNAKILNPETLVLKEMGLKFRSTSKMCHKAQIYHRVMHLLADKTSWHLGHIKPFNPWKWLLAHQLSSSLTPHKTSASEKS